MPQAVAIALQILEYLLANRDQVKKMILDVQDLLGAAPGDTRAGAVRSFIAAAMGIEAQVEAAWPIVAPIFNAFVGVVKAKTAPAAAAVKAA